MEPSEIIDSLDNLNTNQIELILKYIKNRPDFIIPTYYLSDELMIDLGKQYRLDVKLSSLFDEEPAINELRKTIKVKIEEQGTLRVDDFVSQFLSDIEDWL